MLQNIRRLCKENNISMNELTRQAGVSVNAIYKWDINSPSVLTIKKVANVLGVTVDEIIKEDTETEYRQEHG